MLDALKTHGRQYLPNSKLISYSKQIGSGLLYLKQNQIIHRDIAARNIFLSKNLELAKIGDFGLAITTTEIATLPRDIDTLLASKIAVKVRVNIVVNNRLIFYSGQRQKHSNVANIVSNLIFGVLEF